MRELFLATFKGASYGIWKDEILSVRGLDALHRIPLTPDCIAGIMMEDGRSVTLADLPVCIGHDATRKTEPGCILLKEGEHRTLGFVVSGELRTLAISPDLIFPLPAYLRTPVFASCAVHDGVPIPLINLAELHGRVLNPDAADDVRALPAAPHCDISTIARFRFFTCGGERYAAPAEGLEQTAATSGAITSLPNTPRYLRGVSFCNGRLLSVINLARRLKMPASQIRSTTAGSVMLVAKTDEEAFGFLVDSDEGDCPTDEVAVKSAPAIVLTPWLRHVLVRGTQLIPLIDLAATLTPGSGELPVWQRYTPASVFQDVFFRQAVDVQLFTLLGERYALPKAEVEEVIPFQPCRTIPDAPPIVIGITEYKGEILPVVDLAMMFGRRSLATPSWRMMLVSNGDFRALVLTETVSGEQHLPPESHRTMPIHLPHHLIYGCYPDGNAARVILNVAAIVMHFDRSLIQRFMPALSEKMKMSPTAEVYAFPGDQPATATDVSEIHHAEVVVAEQVAQVPIEIPSPQPESAMQSQPDAAEQPEVESHEVEPPEPDIALPSHAQNVSGPLPSTEPPASADSGQSRIAEPVPAAASTASDPQTTGEAEPSLTQASRVKNHNAGARQRNLGYPAIALMLAAALVVFAMLAEEDDVAMPENRNVKETAQATTKTALTISAPSRAEPIAERNPIVPSRPAIRSDEPLVLEIPANMPIEAELYVVKRGDTLWNISQRLTGNPYNYPRIAGSNDIANPDLIFPGQRIRLSRKR